MNGVKWHPGTTNLIVRPGDRLCSDEVLHAYTDPVLATILAPVHLSRRRIRRLIEVQTREVVAGEYGLKVGVKDLTSVREIPMPSLSTLELTRFAILCTMATTKNQTWYEFISKWIDDPTLSESALWLTGLRILSRNTGWLGPEYYASRMLASLSSNPSAYAYQAKMAVARQKRQADMILVSCAYAALDVDNPTIQQ